MNDAKEKIALTSIGASAALTLGKFVAALLSGSLALLSEALHGLIDTAATVMTWLAVRLANKPADDEHHFGHGKIESIAALVEVGLLIALAAGVAYSAVMRLLARQHEVEASALAIGVLVVSIIVDFFRARALTKVAKDTDSHALEADALHFSSDMWSSAFVIIGLIAVGFGFPQGDALAALMVSVMIATAAWMLGRRTVDTLMDAAPSGAADSIRQAVERVRGVIAVEQVRTRKVGATLFADVTVAVPRMLPLDKVAQVKNQIIDGVHAIIPGAEMTVTMSPRALDEESLLERVLLIAATRRVPVHHVTVQQIEDHLAVACDIEVDGRMSLEAAHVIASRFEAALRDEFGAQTEVETHIEPLEPHGLSGRDVEESERASLAAAIDVAARAYPILGDVHDVRVRETPKGRVVQFHCLADPKQTVADVHEAIDAFERDIRRIDPGIVRVVSHAEPRRG